MSERTGPRDAMELICWYLNHHVGETVSVNQIAEDTGLAWETAYNYTIAIRRLSNIAPDIQKTDDGVRVYEQADRVKELYRDPEVAVLNHIFQTLKNEDNMQGVLKYEDNELMFEKYEEAIENAEELGWVEQTDTGVKLTPTGTGIIGPGQSKVINSV